MAPFPLRTHHTDHPAAITTERRHELDWLRVLIIVGLIPFHVIGVFGAAIDIYISGGQPHPLVTVVETFFGLWPMSLLFLVAGASTWFALGRRTSRQYVRERLLRLFVPFLFATLVILPIQVYAVVAAYPEVLRFNIVPDMNLHGNESFPGFYLPYLGGYIYFLMHFTSLREAVFWGHLWFIPRLLLYALATLPLLLWLRGETGRRFIAWVSRLLVAPAGMLLLGLALALPRVLAAAFYRLALASSPATSWDGYNLAAQVGVFLVCFLLGYLFYAAPQLLATAQRIGSLALGTGIAIFALLQTPFGRLASVTQFTPGGIGMACLRSEGEWLLVVGVLAIGLRFLTSGNGVLTYLNEAAYPLYVLHMPVLILVGLWMIQRGLPDALALPLIVALSLALTLAVYEFAVKRIAFLRLLFGLKPMRNATTANGSDSVDDMRHRPDGQHNRHVTQPMGQR